MGQKWGTIQKEIDMARITIKELEALKSDDDGRVLREDGGLTGKVRVGVRGITVLFRYEYKSEGRKKDIRLGSWPKKSLANIRAERDKLRTIVLDGLDPAIARKAKRIQKQKEAEEIIQQAEQERITNLKVSDLFETWLRDCVARQNDNAELKRVFAKDVIPALGDIPLRELSEKNILGMLRKMLNRGVVRLVVVVYNDIKQMLSWGEKRQPWRNLLVDGNPCDLIDIARLLPPDYEEERERILLPDEIRELSTIFKKTELDWLNAPDRRIAKYPIAEKTQIALWLCLSTLCRIGELLMARWEHIDFKERTWYIPRENVKGGRGKKQEHYVFLSDFAYHYFERLQQITGKSEWCFPSRNRKGEDTHICLKSISKQIGDRQVQFKIRPNPLKGRAFDNTLVLSNGANGEWTPHDLRRTGATMMQQLGVPLDIIDRCQNHVLSGSRVRRHYLHHDYRNEKTEAWRLLGERLEEVLTTM